MCLKLTIKIIGFANLLLFLKHGGASLRTCLIIENADLHHKVSEEVRRQTALEFVLQRTYFLPWCGATKRVYACISRVIHVDPCFLESASISKAEIML